MHVYYIQTTCKSIHLCAVIINKIFTMYIMYNIALYVFIAQLVPGHNNSISTFRYNIPCQKNTRR